MFLRFVRRVSTHNRALEAMLVGSQAAGVLGGIIVAQSVGPTGRGIIVTLTVWGQLLGWLAAFSLDKAIVVLASGNDSVASPDEGLRAARLPVLGTSGLAIVAGLLLGRHFFTSSWLTAALATTAIATAQAELIGGWLLAMRRRDAYIWWRLVQPLIYLSVIVAAAVVLKSASVGERTQVMGVGAAASVAVPVIVVLGLLMNRPLVTKRGIGPLLRFATGAHVAIILQYLNGRLDLLVLTFLVSHAGLGYYSAGAALGQLPMLMGAAGTIRGITGDAKRSDHVGIGIAIVLGSVVIFASPLVIPLIFGASFIPAIPIARILALGGIVNYALLGACGRLLGSRQPQTAALSQGIGIVVFGAGIVAFHTLQGVAWSSVASFSVSLIVAEMAIRRKRGPVGALIGNS